MTQLVADYPKRVVCRALAVAPSSFYYTPQAVHPERSRRADEGKLRAAVETLGGEFPTYGSRRMAKQLGRPPYEWRVNRKRARRVLAELGMLRLPKRQVVRTTCSRHRLPRYPNLVADLEITRPDQVWVSDATYIRLREAFVFLAVILDVFTRALRGFALGGDLNAQLTLAALRPALRQRVPEIHHSDQGREYAAHDYVDALQALGVQISMAEVGRADQNGYAERVIRTLKEEEVYLSDYRDLHEAREQIGRFITDVYQTKRIHSALGYLTPVEFETHWRKQHAD